MWITHSITTRLFVGLATLAIPFQGLPAAACGCAQAVFQSSGMSGPSITSRLATSRLAQETDCCSQSSAGQCPCTGASVCRCGEVEPTCCSGASATDSGCQCAGGCQCGDNCQCGQDNTPTEPTLPPVEESSPDRIAVNSTSTASFSTVFLPPNVRLHLGRNARAHALTALDSCTRLCRFTL